MFTDQEVHEESVGDETESVQAEVRKDHKKLNLTESNILGIKCGSDDFCDWRTHTDMFGHSIVSTPVD